MVRLPIWKHRMAGPQAAAGLWTRVQAAEAEHQAAIAREAAFGVTDPSAAWVPPEYFQACDAAREAWVNAEQARHELDACLHPRRYARRGHRAEALDRFRAAPDGSTRPAAGPQS